MKKPIIHFGGIERSHKKDACNELRITLCITRSRNTKDESKYGDYGHIYTTEDVNDVTCERCLKLIKEKGIVNNPRVVSTDCRSEAGVTVGLIDSIITVARVLKNRDLSSYEAIEALRDLKNDEDLRFIMSDKI